MKHTFKVLSLFDGISCTQQALLELSRTPRGGKYAVTHYYASEIDKYAMAVTQAHFPHTQQIGDVTKVNGKHFNGIDLLIGGSPCQDLSGAKRDRKGIVGERSKLLFEYARILKEANPKWWVLENVASMNANNREAITQIMGVEPIMIDASLVSAQSRKRLFWTNIPVKKVPADRGFVLRDIVEDVDFEDYDMGRHKGRLAHINIRKSTRTLDQKMKTLGTQMRATVTNGTLIEFDDGRKRIPTPVECERAQCLPDNYTLAAGSNTQRYKCIGNGFNVEVIKYILSHI